MKKNLLLILFIISLSIQNFSQIQVRIEVISNSIKPNEKIIISGNTKELGNWDPDIVALDKINDSTWAQTFNFKKNDLIEFKFTKGNWESEALNSDETIPGNFKLLVSSDTVLHYRINHWKNARTNVVKHITGKVDYYPKFKGENLLPRDVIVWLPPSYDSLTEKRYPVLYMQDGQNIFDPSTSSFGTDWQIDETADSLIRYGAINEIIIVGIYNTARRSEEYVNSDSGYAYIKFMVNQLKPFIDKTYRTLVNKENTAVGGSSLGGLISFMLAWEYPDVFSKAACLSPAFKIGKIDFVTDVERYDGPKKQIEFYIDNGGVDLDKELQPGVDKMLSALANKGYELGKDIYYFKDEKATHNEKAWATRVYRFLEYFFGTEK